jgi:hypothetical protein
MYQPLPDFLVEWFLTVSNRLVKVENPGNSPKKSEITIFHAISSFPPEKKNHAKKFHHHFLQKHYQKHPESRFNNFHELLMLLNINRLMRKALNGNYVFPECGKSECSEKIFDWENRGFKSSCFLANYHF